MEQWVVVTGNPIDGITLFGLFDDMETAREWAQIECRHIDWWLVKVEKAR